MVIGIFLIEEGFPSFSGAQVSVYIMDVVQPISAIYISLTSVSVCQKQDMYINTGENTYGNNQQPRQGPPVNVQHPQPRWSCGPSRFHSLLGGPGTSSTRIPFPGRGTTQLRCEGSYNKNESDDVNE